MFFHSMLSEQSSRPALPAAFAASAIQLHGIFVT